MCEELAQGCYLTLERPGVERATVEWQVARPTNQTTRPHAAWRRRYRPRSRRWRAAVSWCACAERRRDADSTWRRRRVSTGVRQVAPTTHRRRPRPPSPRDAGAPSGTATHRVRVTHLISSDLISPSTSPFQSGTATPLTDYTKYQ